jgi:type II secretory pathway component PulM
MAWLRAPLAARNTADPSRLAMLVSVASVIVIALALIVGAAPLRSSIARGEDSVARSRLMLEIARERVADSEGLARISSPLRVGDTRAAVERVLARHVLQAAPAALRPAEGRVGIVIAAGHFDAIVRALDALARDEGVHLVEGTITALVDPGAVRAELTLAR